MAEFDLAFVIRLAGVFVAALLLIEAFELSVGYLETGEFGVDVGFAVLVLALALVVSALSRLESDGDAQ